MVSKIDYNRGVQKRTHDGMGIAIYMYKDEPGVYLSVQGTTVSEDLARQAGFDVEKHRKARTLKERMATAEGKIRAELEAANENEVIVIAERKGFKVVDIGMDRHQVRDPDGEVLHKHPLPKEQALQLLQDLTPEA